MSDLKINNITPTLGNIKVGSTNVSEIYCGNTLVWPPSSPSIACNLIDVTIGTQIWKGCNLNVETYNDNTPIPEVTDPTEWANLTTGAWCYYDNDSANGPIYGKLYNWYAVNDPRGLAPTGYHVPSQVEWDTMVSYLGGALVAGGKMKSTGTIEGNDGLWLDPNTGATNSSGFTGLPGGLRNFNGTFYFIGSDGYWWSSSEDGTNYAWSRSLNNNLGSANMYSSSKRNGFSVRLIKNE
jgi:uncharacterized protein (TIGR02145 family)